MAGGADSTGVPGAVVDSSGVLHVAGGGDDSRQPDSADAGQQPGAGAGQQPGAGPAQPPAAQEEP
jgi:hypothetical protein